MRSRKKTADAMARVWAASFRPESRVLSAEKGRCRVGGLSPPPSSSLSSGHGRHGANHSGRLCHAVAGSLAGRVAKLGARELGGSDGMGGFVLVVVVEAFHNSRCRCWQPAMWPWMRPVHGPFADSWSLACAPHIFGGVARGKAKLSSVVGHAQLGFERKQNLFCLPLPLPFPLSNAPIRQCRPSYAQ